ncbi:MULTISPECIES: M48 family metallopeptidase [Aliiglaciecola]|uniref:M48 family metallopeptidase n=1 Tax=Aliiglaciecola TaxID=1406885 RepID=UPI001C08E4D3|nr:MULTISPECIES: M48 family metallopeptidase [Aliiglaciecola]MBU2876567.1 M48 family metallopeptidase [Aliiglaciecola lipolytica]MDO6711498.1 M48 family metallopeptidase [Aliiglaciecola sp. 2_MG-2023]MDO6752526.1 M48 family metallopeptidase [Aliiglaciecola sp. 1_MG-2023]
MFKHISKTCLAATISAVLLTACSTSPTGRSQLKLYSKDQLADMGAQAFDGMKIEQKVSQQGVDNQYVSCVAGFITKHVPSSVFDGQWELVVFEDDQVNAFALPGGKIGVYTGLLKVAQNQDQLAAVIGHEVGHVIAEHGNERMSNSALIGIGLEATNQILNAKQVANSNMIMAGIGLGVQVGVQLPFSRTHETEADLIGLELMARAGFDPTQSVELWKNMDKASDGQRTSEFMSTHPSPTTRIETLTANMSAAQALANQATDKPNCKM